MATLDSGNAVPDRTDWRGALVFAGIAAVIVGCLGWFAAANRESIALNRQLWLATQLEALLGATPFDNEPLADAVYVRSPDRLGTDAPVPVYRARRGGDLVAVVLLPFAPDGYGGPIRLMVAIDTAGTLLGVAVLEHHETPGLGDAFATAGSMWLAAFAGRSLADPAGSGRWKVRQEGGDFDAFTGASITPRAIVKAVHRTLEYYQANREVLDADPE